jgi:5'-nucleotidase/UDP-sugar diphosphatase
MKRSLQRSTGIDVIVGGHSHTLLSNTQERCSRPYPTMVANPSGVDVPIVQAYAYSKFLGEVKVTFDDAGKVISAEGEPHLLDASVAPDEAFLARVTELGAPIEELKNKIVAAATDMIEGSRDVCRAMECAMGNLVADAMLDRVSSQGVSMSRSRMAAACAPRSTPARSPWAKCSRCCPSRTRSPHLSSRAPT